MIRILSAVSLFALLSACGDGQPFFDNEADTGDEEIVTGNDESEEDGISGDGDRPPGTESPSPGESIVRFEPMNEETGGGFVTDVSYDADTDTFTVDNLAFDGLNTYDRNPDISSLNNDPDTIYAVYEAPVVVTDSLTGEPINQFQYAAVYGVSRNSVENAGEIVPRSRFAIVRTGSYVGYGFGGFVYERNGSVELPTTGQAGYEGEYAGIVVYNGAGGLSYVNGSMTVAIDFDDFNDGAAVQGRVTDREYFDENGNAIATGPAPDLTFAVGPGVLDVNGEMQGEVSSVTVGDDGALEVFESGTYYGILSGDDAEELVGVIVVESTDADTGISAQETGGFILYRD